MPTKDDIDKAIENIYRHWNSGGNAAPIRDAMVVIAAYREELYKSIGVKEYSDGK